MLLGDFEFINILELILYKIISKNINLCYSLKTKFIKFKMYIFYIIIFFFIFSILLISSFV